MIELYIICWLVSICCLLVRCLVVVLVSCQRNSSHEKKLLDMMVDIPKIFGSQNDGFPEERWRNQVSLYNLMLKTKVP